MNWERVKDIGSLLGCIFSALAGLCDLIRGIIDFLKDDD